MIWPLHFEGGEEHPPLSSSHLTVVLLGLEIAIALATPTAIALATVTAVINLTTVIALATLATFARQGHTPLGAAPDLYFTMRHSVEILNVLKDRAISHEKAGEAPPQPGLVSARGVSRLAARRFAGGLPIRQGGIHAA